MKEEKYLIHFHDWFCSKCGAYINAQNGYSNRIFEWKCTECGYKNIISTTSKSHQVTLQHDIDDTYREIDHYVHQKEKLKHWLIYNFLNQNAEEFSFNNSKIQTDTNFDIEIKSRKIFKDDKYHTIEILPAFKYTQKFDEKNNPSKVPYFAFEVSSLYDRDEEYVGELFKKEADSTEYFMLLWVWVNLPYSDEYLNNFRLIDLSNFYYSSIKEVFLQIIPKKDLIEHIKQYGVSTENYKKIDYEYRFKYREKMDKSNSTIMKLNTEGVYPCLLLDNRFASRPIYVMVKSSNLDNIALHSQSISPNYIEDFNLTKRKKEICNLYQEGKSLSEIKNLLNIKKDETIVKYLTAGAYNGEVMSFDSRLSRWTKFDILKALQKRDDGKLKTIYENTNKEVSFDEIKKFLLELYLSESTKENLYYNLENEMILEAEQYVNDIIDSPNYYINKRKSSNGMENFLNGALDGFDGNSQAFWDSYND